MTNIILKQLIINKLDNDGFDFSRNQYQLSCSELCDFKDLAKQVKYKGTKLHSIGFSFYVHLQKIYDKTSLVSFVFNLVKNFDKYTGGKEFVETHVLKTIDVKNSEAWAKKNLPMYFNGDFELTEIHI